tara:strand:- start:32848 stop:33657 length:810 start_codon:yes stop_codon:yes gene_type:complete
VISIRKLIREPMFVFIVGGSVLFVLDSGNARSGDGRSAAVIEIDEQVLALAVDNRERLTGKPLSELETKAALDAYVDEEILVREAYRRGLHDDGVIRSRLKNKMRLLLGANHPEPERADLERWYAEHAEEYAEPTQWTLEQVYLPRDQAAPDNVLQMLEQAGAGAFEWRDNPRFPRHLQAESTESIAARFGQHVADAVDEASGKDWFGPVLSPYGSHYFRVIAREAGEVPPFEHLAAYIERDWREAQINSSVDRALAGLRQQYRVLQVD